MIRATIARMSDVPALRASDADRERTVVLLKEHAAQGRLTRVALTWLADAPGRIRLRDPLLTRHILGGRQRAPEVA